MRVEKNRYFEFMKVAILCVSQQSQTKKMKFETIDGHWLYIAPSPTPFYLFNDQGQIIEMILFCEFPINEEFKLRVFEDRENKTRVRKKISNRDFNLSSVLNIYYKNYDFLQKSKEKKETLLKKEEEILALKRCGYRNIYELLSLIKLNLFSSSMVEINKQLTKIC